MAMMAGRRRPVAIAAERGSPDQQLTAMNLVTLAKRPCSNSMTTAAQLRARSRSAALAAGECSSSTSGTIAKATVR